MNRLILPLLMYKESGSERKGTKKAHNVVPSWNHLYTIVIKKMFKNKKEHITATPILDEWALRHKNIIKSLAEEWREKNNWDTTEKQKVFVDVWVYWDDAREKDCHNLDKLILDAFEDAGVYDNDSNALLRYQDFDVDIENSRIEVEFTKGELFDRKIRTNELRKEKAAKERTEKKKTKEAAKKEK